MTKRYLESLPIEEQNAILGGPDYFQRLAAEPMPASPVSLEPEPAKCSRCGVQESLNSNGLCEWCQMRTDRNAICDRYYGSRR
jgi:hypothetical protein